MRASVASLSKKLISTFFAAALALGLVPAAALAVEDNGVEAPKSAESAIADSFNTEDFDQHVISSEVEKSADTPSVIPSDSEESAEGLTYSFGEDETVDTATGSDAVIPAATQRINQDMTLQTRTVAQAESTRNYFLAQTLESTRTVSIVSANLPLDTGTANIDDPKAEGEGFEDESSEDSDESDPAPDVIAADSTVVGSFTYLGMTFAVEPGGESVALVAVDYSKFPETYIEKQIIVIPDSVTANGVDYYSVTRIADDAFASLTKENANPDYKSCEVLFSDEELLAEADIEASEVEAFLNSESEMVDIDGDGVVDAPVNPLKDCTGILAMGVPASVTNIGDEAFAGFDTLQYLVVSENNPNYASYDGALYSADLTDIRLIPEGRVGAVRVAPSATDVDPEVFSHCPSVTTLVADPESSYLSDGITLEFKPHDSLDTMLFSLFSRVSLLYVRHPDGLPISTQISHDSSVLYAATTWSLTIAGNGGTVYKDDVSTNTQTLTISVVPASGNTKFFGSGGHFLIHTTSTSNALTVYKVKRTGYTQTSWRSSTGASIGSSTGTTGINPTASGQTFTATWTANTYTVTLNNQSATTAGSTSVTATYDSAMPAITKPARTGYTFGGYYTAANGGGTQYYKADGGSARTWNLTSNTTLYAKWTANTYTVTLNNQSATTAGSTSVTATYDSAMPAITKPARTGYTFGGYYTAANGGGTQYYKADGGSARTWNLTSNTTLYAKWTANTYTVTLNNQSADSGKGGTSSFTATYDSAFTSNITIPVKTGYTFGGYYTSTGGSGTQFFAADGKPTTNKWTTASASTLYAKWTANKYTVTLNQKDGTGGTASVTATFGSAMPSAMMPTKSNFNFAGYYDAESGGNMYYTAAGASNRSWDKASNTTLYARWTAKTYTITYEMNGHGTQPTSPTSWTYGNAVTLPTPEAVSGYTFGGWYKESACTNSASITATTSGNQTVWAKWTPNTYTVTLNAKGGSGGTESVTATHGSAMPAATMPVKDGCSFAGYYDAESGGTMYYTATGASNKSWDKASNTTLYARYTSNTYTITYEMNGHGTKPTSPVSWTYGNAVTLPTPEAVTGYTFDGWYKEAACTNTASITASTLGNQTVWAKWTPNTYTVTLDAKGGKNGTASVTASYGSAMPTATMPTKDGYTFAGYYDVDADTGGNQYYTAAGASANNWNKAGAHTLYARWNKIGSYSVELSDPRLGCASQTIWYWPGNGYVAGSQDSTAVITKLASVPDMAPDYEFLGYFDGKDGGTTKMIAADGTIIAGAPSGNTTWYAQWKHVSCPVVLVAQYGDFTVENKGTESVAHAAFGAPFKNSLLVGITPPVRKGYTFMGYYETPYPEMAASTPESAYVGTRWIDGRGVLSGQTWVRLAGFVDKASVTLYAAWRLDDCTVTFDLSTPANTEPVAGDVAEQTWQYGQPLPETFATPSAFTFSRNGYSFGGWYYEEPGEGGTTVKRFVCNPDGSRKIENWDRDYGTVTLKAEWEANDYVLVFDAAYPEGDDAASPYEVRISYDQPLSVTNPVFEPYTFAGWVLALPLSGRLMGTHTTAGRFTPRGSLVSQISPAHINVQATWDMPVDATYHLYTWTPGADDTDIQVADLSYAYDETVALGKSTYPGVVAGWKPGGWVEVRDDAAARALIADPTSLFAESTTSSFGPGVNAEKFFVFKWLTVPFSVSFKTEPLNDADTSYVKATDVLLDRNIGTGEDTTAPLTWSAVCAAVGTGDAAHVTYLPYAVTTSAFTLPNVSRKGYDFKGWRQVSPETPVVGDVIDPKVVAENPVLHELVFEPIFEESVYTIMLEPGTEGREAKRFDVRYNDTFSFPYPDVLNTGACFSSWKSTVRNKSFAPLQQVPMAQQNDGSFALSDLDTDGDKVITLYAAWSPAYNVTVPISVTTMAIDTQTGDMIAASNALHPAIPDEEYEVVSLRMEPVADDDGNAPFSGTGSGRVYLSVYAGMPDPADELSLLRKENVGAAGALSYADRGGITRNVNPLLVELGDAAVSFVNKEATVGSTETTLDAATDASVPYGFRTFTKANPLTIRYGLVFDGVDPKVFDYVPDAGTWTLPENDAGNTETTEGHRVGWSSTTKALAKLCYMVRLLSE